MKKNKVKFLQPALNDLEEIILYIAQDSPDTALKVHDEIISKARKLEDLPNLGRQVPNKKMNESGFRMLLISPYIVFCKTIGDIVYIYRVMHGARNYPSLYSIKSQEGLTPDNSETIQTTYNRD